jgi:hypothetical protein
VRVQIGPMASGGVTIWIAYARTVIGQALVHPTDLGVRLEPDVIETFDELLDRWDALAADSTEFYWVAEVDPERIEVLARAFLTLAEALTLAAERRGYSISPTEGEPFYHALVNAFLDALAQEGQSQVEFAEQVRQQWPGLKPS